MWENLKEEDIGYFGIEEFVKRSMKKAQQKANLEQSNLEPGTIRKIFF